MTETQQAPAREDPGRTLPAIELAGVQKAYHAHGETVAAVRGVDLEIAQGEFFSLLGPSGCGKTTTMRVIAGFEEPTAGRVRLHGRDVTGVPPNRRDVNMVFQSYALFPHMSVFENVAFGLRRRGVPKAEITRRVGDMLGIVDLAGREKRRPAELSGGQQQRIAIAVAVANEPKVVLADEPTGELDTATAAGVFAALRRVNEELGTTTVVVTHDAQVSERVDRTVGIRDGRTSVEVRRGGGTAEEYALLDRAGRVQLPAAFTESLDMRDRVRLALESDHVGVWPDREEPHE